MGFRNSALSTMSNLIAGMVNASSLPLCDEEHVGHHHRHILSDIRRESAATAAPSYVSKPLCCSCFADLWHASAVYALCDIVSCVH